MRIKYDGLIFDIRALQWVLETALTGFVLTQGCRWAILSGAVGCPHLRSRVLLFAPLRRRVTKEASDKLKIWWASPVGVGGGSAERTALENRNWQNWKFPMQVCWGVVNEGSCTQMAVSQQPEGVRSSNWYWDVPQDVLDPSVSSVWVCGSGLMSRCDC